MRRDSARQKGKEFETLVGNKLGLWWRNQPFPRAHGSGSSSTHKIIHHQDCCLYYAGDLYVSQDFPWCVECKNQQEVNIHNLFGGKSKTFWLWWQQCCRDAERLNKHPMLCFTRNRLPAYMMILADMWNTLYPSHLCIDHLIISHENHWFLVCILDQFLSNVATSVVRDLYVQNIENIKQREISSNTTEVPVLRTHCQGQAGFISTHQQDSREQSTPLVSQDDADRQG